MNSFMWENQDWFAVESKPLNWNWDFYVRESEIAIKVSHKSFFSLIEQRERKNEIISFDREDKGGKIYQAY